MFAKKGSKNNQMGMRLVAMLARVGALVDAAGLITLPFDGRRKRWPRPPGHSHYTLGQDGWEEVADHALEWAEANATRPAARA